MSEWSTTIWPMLENTPWWVYLIFVLLVIRGVKASRPQLVSLRKLFIMPFILLIGSLYMLLGAVTPSLVNIMVWLICLFIGGALIFMQIQRQTLQFDKKRHLVKTSGTWTVLILILLIFFSKYYFDYTLAVDPQEIHHLIFRLSLCGISGLCNGLIMVRLICYLIKMRQAEHMELK